MSGEQYELSPELIEAVKELIPSAFGMDFATLFEQYRTEDGGLSEQDLINEILEAGGYQAEEGESFDDIVMIGAIAIAGPLGLL